MDLDPAASLRLWAVELDLAGQTFEIPALPAADWLPFLMDGELVGVLDLVEGSEQIDEMIVSGEVKPAELVTAISAAVEQATGRSPQVTMVLAQVARQLWAIIGGDLARRGFRWDQVSIGAALDAIYWTAHTTLKPEIMKDIEALIQAPPVTAGTGRRARPNRRQAMQAFEDMAGPRPSPAPPPAKATGGPSAGERPRTRPRPRQRPQGGP